MSAPARRARQRRQQQAGFDGDLRYASTPTLVSEPDVGPSSSRIMLQRHSSERAPSFAGVPPRSRSVEMRGRTREQDVGYLESDPTLANEGLGMRATRRVLAVVRRSGGFKNSRREQATSSALYSTPEEMPLNIPLAGPTRTPSVRQIAMGLHTSRTPHLGHQSAALSAVSASSSATRVSPLRPSLKGKIGAAQPAGTPSSSRSSTPGFGFTSLRSRVDKLLGRSPQSSAASFASTSSDSSLTRRKTVRFTVTVEEEPGTRSPT